MDKGDWIETFAAAAAKLGGGVEPRFVERMRRSGVSVELYAPRGHDPQQPHDRDELYVVVAGSGRFDRDGELRDFGPGDVIFVPAGMPHRFVEFGDDFFVWVIFFGDGAS